MLQRIRALLLRLRQLCCHPQLGSDTGFQRLARNPLSMEVIHSFVSCFISRKKELLDVMISRARVETEEAQRRLVFNKTALAGLHWIQGRVLDAARVYRNILAMDSEVRVDLLQRIHAVHNLIEAVETMEKRDDVNVEDVMELEERESEENKEALREKERLLKNEFLTERTAPITVRLMEARQIKAEIDSRFDPANWIEGEPWWLHTLRSLDEQGAKSALETIRREIEMRSDPYGNVRVLVSPYD